jgi:hypothetical protein
MFEYHVHTASVQNLQKVLDEHARKGWQLHTCAFMPTYNEFAIVFLRARDQHGHRIGRDDYFGPG